MKMKTSRLVCSSLLAAATVLALPSCKDDAATTENTPKQTASKATDSAAAEKRAAFWPALALLPGDVSDYFAATNVGDNLLRLATSGLIPGATAEDIEAEAQAIDSIALATTASTPASCAALEAVLKARLLLMANDIFSLCGDNELQHPDAIKAGLEESLREMGFTRNSEGKMVLDGQEFHIPATYAVVTTKPGHDEVCQKAYDNILSGIRAHARSEECLVNDVNGFSGIRMTFSPDEDNDMAATLMVDHDAFGHLFNQRSFYVLVRRQGNAVIMALCEDPATLRLAKTPADSMLATSLTAPADAHLGKGMVASAHISKELLKINDATGYDGLLAMVPACVNIFSKLGEKDAAHQVDYAKAAAAVEVLAQPLKALSRPINHPADVQVWYDNGLHITGTADARGATYLPGKLRLTAVKDSPSTIIYAESTPSEIELTLPSAEQWLNALCDMARGISFVLPEEEQLQFQGGLAIAEAFRPAVLSVLDAFSTIGSGLDGHTALVLDSTTASLPAMVDPSCQTGEMPRLSIYAGVSDRSKISAGWDNLLSTAGQIATMCGGDPSFIHSLPIVPTAMGAATSYKVAIPFVFTPEFMPSLTISDSGLALGTSDSLNTQLVNSATGQADFAGAVFSFRLAPLAKTLTSLAETKKDKDLSQVAAVVTHLSNVVEGVYAQSTVEGAIHTLSIDVMPKKQ